MVEENLKDSKSNNERIAKNTLFLYFRMFVLMAVSLYTSRVVLQTLGIQDYGIYNVVGGIVAMVGIFNTSMASSIQRYLSFEIGKGDRYYLRKVFNVCFFIYVFLSVIFLLVAETIGLWFLNTQLVIPDDRIAAANWIYQFSIFSVINSLLSNPFNATIIAHEKMNAFAFISILEALLKLAIVFVLLVIPYDRLIIYGFLVMLISFLVTMIYRSYCLKHFPESHLKWYGDKTLFKELLSYSGWNLFGSAANVAKGQGLNILLNMFFNPSVNAARGIAYQVNTAVSSFFSNFYTAVRPQITKYYAQDNREEMLKLVFRSSKFAFFLIFILSLPIIIEAPYIINLWLGQLPELVVPFVRIILVITAIDAMANPIMTVAHATGKIALYQMSVGTMTILNIPISYVFLKLGFSPIVVFIVSLIISVICMFMRLAIVYRLIRFPVAKYIKEVYGSALVVTIIAPIIPVLLHIFCSQSLLSVILVCITSVLISCLSIYILALSKQERSSVLNLINHSIKHK